MADRSESDATPPTASMAVTRGEVASGPRSDYDGPQPGDTVGRYELTSELGAGGMGVVMAAYDPKLDRTVALKLLRSGSDVAVQRLLREARALAMLQHPGVITVFEVGEVDGQHYISMEYVQGRTLKRWLAQMRPGWEAILEMLLQAGRGLAAAHAVGLVHRDVKPGNVLVADGGRARVVDFGIATPRALGLSGESMRTSGHGDSAHDDGPDTPPVTDKRDGPQRDGPQRDGPLLDGLTLAGQVVGTPAYMAPEQHRGEAVDARSDQFSFCVMAFECLFERRPFHATSLRAVARRKFAGEIESIPADTDVPPRIREAVLKGLSSSPDKRWATMQELLESLELPAKARSRLWVVGALAGGVGVAAGGVAVLRHEDPKAKCDAGAEQIDGTWTKEHRAALDEAFVATGLVYSDQAAKRVGGWLDRYAGSWKDKHDELCAAVHVESGLAEADFDLQMACLRRRLAEFDAMVEVLTHADREIVREGTQAAATMRPVTDCENLLALRNEGPSSESPRSGDPARPYWQKLARAQALGQAGKFNDALVEAEAVLADLPADAAPRLAAEAGLVTGRLASKTANYKKAETVLTAAYHAASETGHDRLAAKLAGHLAYVVGYQLARFDDALRWARYAHAAAERGGLDALSKATVESNISAIYFAKGDFEAASAGLEEALNLRLKHLHEGHPQIAVSLFNLGGLRIQQGELAIALPQVQRALQIWEAQLGPTHPLVASALMSLAAIHEAQAQYGDAIPLLRRALEIREAENGSEHPDTGSTLDSLASALLYNKEYAEAERHARRGKEIRFRALPDPHPHRAASLTNLGMALAKLHRADEAATTLQQAIDMWGRTVGEDHPHAAYPMTALGGVLVELGKPAEAVAILEKAIAIRAAPSVGERERAETAEALAVARDALLSQQAASP